MYLIDYDFIIHNQLYILFFRKSIYFKTLNLKCVFHFDFSHISEQKLNIYIAYFVIII